MTSALYARQSLAAGSKSFAAATRLMPSGTRDDVARLYAWCRHCDDVVDGQSGGHGAQAVEDPAGKLDQLRHQTERALQGRPTGLPVFDGFGEVARAHGITPALANDHLAGFAQDVAGATYPTLDALAFYCYGVAGSVGVMMALVMGVRPDDGDTLDRACDLGLAFQMTNIARDVIADAEVARVYLPADWLAAEGIAATPEAVRAPHNADGVYRATSRLIDAAEPYYRSAAVGVGRLPFRAAWAVAAAKEIYRAIGVKRRSAGPAGLAWRARTGRREKLRMIVSGAIATRGAPQADRAGLWQRPPRP